MKSRSDSAVEVLCERCKRDAVAEEIANVHFRDIVLLYNLLYNKGDRYKGGIDIDTNEINLDWNSKDAVSRYIRQMTFKPFGVDGQERLLKSRVLVVGCGGLGSTIAEILVRSGVGYIRLVDRDYVEMHNIHRQILYDESDIYKPKAIAASEKLKKINSEVEIDAYDTDFNGATALRLIDGIDLMVDGTDNFQVRFLMNDLAVRFGIPWIYGATIGGYGSIMDIIPGETPCLRCYIRDMPAPGTFDTCETGGILSPLPNIIGSIEALEAIKYLSGNQETMIKGLLFIDAWFNSYNIVNIKRNDECPCCIQEDFQFLNLNNPDTVSLCSSDSFEVFPYVMDSINLKSIYDRLKEVGIDVSISPYLLSFETEGKRLTLFRDGRAIIKGAKNKGEAKEIYARYIGF
ncbi:ThiF family adenylyltransferase [Calorimonas adulescens]|uniref:ThiF family adenylyltransferase n=1 Tax=Calorimonas adulescens TaxID=2606906 RepID=UPI00139698D9|nr:ThiF family adenylyltransferase [Calorimonas adulescens]